MGTDIHIVAQILDSGEWKTVTSSISDDRNYDTFAVYANVRNGVGFAGCKTGDKWHCISEPRGFPKDFNIDESVDMGDHSFSWLLLSEIEREWNDLAGRKYRQNGIVERSEFQDTLWHGFSPTKWCGGVFGGCSVVAKQSDVMRHLAPLNYTHVECEWDVPAHDRLRLMASHIYELGVIARQYGKTFDQVRIVFGFDS